MENKHGINRIDGTTDEDLQTAFEAIAAASSKDEYRQYRGQEMSRVEDNHKNWLTFAPVIREMQDEFLQWREKIVRQCIQKDWWGREKVFTEKDLDEAVKTMGNIEETYWRQGALPGNEFYLEHMLPTLITIAETPEQLREISRDAIEAYQYLLVWNRSGGSGKAPRYLPRNFFANRDSPQKHGMGADVSGQFKYFYTRYGKWFTLAVSYYQGWSSDRYYGDGDWCEGVGKIERTFCPVHNALPEELREGLWKAFIAYGGERRAEKFLQAVPGVIEKFEKMGRKDLLKYYFAMAERAPNISHEGDTDMSFPILSADDAFEECLAIDEVSEFKDDLIKIAQYILDHGKDRSYPTFKNEKKLRIFYSGINLPDILQQLKNANCSTKQIKQMFDLPFTHPWLKESAVTILQRYAEIEKNFPGGVQNLLVHLEQMKHAPKCMWRLTLNAAENQLMRSGNVETYLRGAHKVVGKLGDGAYGYFQYYDLMHPQYLSLLENESLFMQRLEEALALTDVVPEALSIGDGGTRSLVLSSYLDILGQGGDVESYRRAVEYFAKAAQKAWDSLSAQERKGRHRTLSECIDAAIDGYLSICEENIPLDHVIKIIVRLTIEQGEVRYGGVLQKFLNVVREGHVDYRVAVLMAVHQRANHPGLSILDGIDLPIEAQKLELMTEVVYKTRAALAAVYRTDVGRLDYVIEHAKSKKKAGQKPKDIINLSLVKNLLGEKKRIEALERDPEMARVFNFKKIKGEIDQAMRMAQLKDALQFSIGTAKEGIHASEFLANTNPATRTAVTGMSLLVALGVRDVPEMKGRLKPLPGPRGGTLMGIQGATDLLEHGRFQNALVENMRIALPHVERQVMEARRRSTGYMAIGEKVHTQQEMDPRVVQFIQGLFGRSQTCFHLIHANQSMVMPPLPTALELKMLTALLECFGAIQEEKPEIQTAMAGRWNEEYAGIVGASMLLSTRRGVVYEPGAFGTTHNSETGARIMAYDAGVRERNLPFDLPEAQGRTDMLGRRIYSDLDTYQVLGTLATHAQFNGPMKGVMQSYSQQFMKILQKYGLTVPLRQSAWVYDHKKEGDSLQAHEAMVSSFTQAWMQSAQRVDLGIIREVNDVIARASQEMEAVGYELGRENPKELEKLMTF